MPNLTSGTRHVTLQQGEARQNTFSDQKGTLFCLQLYTVAGDSIEIKISRVESEFGGGYNEKHSGKYIVKQVGHHLLSDGRGYTKVKTIFNHPTRRREFQHE